MNILDIAKLFKDKLGCPVYPLNFPECIKGTFIKVEINSGVQELGGVQDFNVLIMVKSDHPAKAEELANNILNVFDGLTNEDFAEGKYQLILAKAPATVPYFEGESEAGEYIFSVGFRLLTSKL